MAKAKTAPRRRRTALRKPKEMNIGWAMRPPGLKGRDDVFGLIVQGNCMAPHYQTGEVVYGELRAGAVGDIVIVELNECQNGHPRRLLKRLVSEEPDHLVCLQYNPVGRIEIERGRVNRVLRVVPNRELWPLPGLSAAVVRVEG